ncbi:MAG: tetratricopeptide repeat protein [Thermoplasmata archaeon]
MDLLELERKADELFLADNMEEALKTYDNLFVESRNARNFPMAATAQFMSAIIRTKDIKKGILAAMILIATWENNNIDTSPFIRKCRLLSEYASQKKDENLYNYVMLIGAENEEILCKHAAFFTPDKISELNERMPEEFRDAFHIFVAIILAKGGNFDVSMFVLKEMEEEFTAETNRKGIGITLGLMAEACRLTKRFDEALGYVDKLQEYKEDVGAHAIYYLLGDIYLSKEDFGKAKENFELAMREAEASEDFDGMFRSVESLISIAQTTANKEDAAKYADKYEEFKQKYEEKIFRERMKAQDEEN